MTDSRWGGILLPRDKKGITEAFRKSLLNRMGEEDAAGSLHMLYGMRDKLLGEISSAKRITGEIEMLTRALPGIDFADGLKMSMGKFTGLVGELYHARSAVASIFALARTFYDSLLPAAFEHAVDQLAQEGTRSPELHYALLTSGELGRGESVLGNRSGFLLIYREGEGIKREFINELAMRFMAVLSVCFPSISRNQKSPTPFWYGSEAQWRATVDEQLRAGMSDKLKEANRSAFASMLETVADMRSVCGDAGLSSDIIAHGEKIIALCLQSEHFRLHARDVAAMPLALGLFGRFKTVRSGENKGKFDLREMAIDPLVSSARLLALPCPGRNTTFFGRVKAILATGNMGVALADKLLIAYQDFMRERIRLELAGNGVAGGIFLDPEQLDDPSKERFREEMEDVTTIQRFVHQQLVEVATG